MKNYMNMKWNKMKKYFTLQNLVNSLVFFAFAKILKDFLSYFFGITIPPVYKDPLNIYRILHMIILTGFSMILRKIWKRFFK